MDGVEPQVSQDPVTMLRDLSAQWFSASDRAFASGLTDPAAYARTVRLVTATLGALRTRGDGADELLAAWSDRRALITTVAASDELLTLDGLDLAAVAGAAFAMRYREVSDAIARTRRLDALAAHDGSTPWVVVEESGPYSGDPFVPYRRLEVAPDSERAILVTTRANDDFTAPLHQVEGLHFDSATGSITSPANAEDDLTSPEFATVEERERHVASLRAATGPVP